MLIERCFNAIQHPRAQHAYCCLCSYPRFTMLFQSIGSMLYAWKCLRAFNPDIFVDSTGYSFTFVIAKLFAGCKVACYVHYPTITKVGIAISITSRIQVMR
jgi:hypothetical protein